MTIKHGRKGYVHFVLLVDASGSMYNAMEGISEAVTRFIGEQASLGAGESTVLLADFSQDFDGSHVLKVHHDGATGTCPEYNLRVRGDTPLYDAIGTAIKATDDKLAKLAPEQRPAEVVVVIQTDGNENASQFTPETSLRGLIQQRMRAGWTFVFLGMGMDVWVRDQARKIGIPADHVTVTDTNDGDTYRIGYDNLSANVIQWRIGNTPDLRIAAHITADGRIT